jgi:hypothetical protein
VVTFVAEEALEGVGVGVLEGAAIAEEEVVVVGAVHRVERSQRRRTYWT